MKYVELTLFSSSIYRVTSLAGIDDALFLTADVEHSFRMNEDFIMVISDDLIGLQSFNFPTYLLLKAVDLHTLAVLSTDDIEKHPISAFLRGNKINIYSVVVRLNCLNSRRRILKSRKTKKNEILFCYCNLYMAIA